eukprot:2341895-Amphidinium_carterae.1
MEQRTVQPDEQHNRDAHAALEMAVCEIQTGFARHEAQIQELQGWSGTGRGPARAGSAAKAEITCTGGDFREQIKGVGLDHASVSYTHLRAHETEADL